MFSLYFRSGGSGSDAAYDADTDKENNSPQGDNEAATHITISMFIIIFFNTTLSCSRVFKLKATFDAKQRYEIKDIRMCAWN